MSEACAAAAFGSSAATTPNAAARARAVRGRLRTVRRPEAEAGARRRLRGRRAPARRSIVPQTDGSMTASVGTAAAATAPRPRTDRLPTSQTLAKPPTGSVRGCRWSPRMEREGGSAGLIDVVLDSAPILGLALQATLYRELHRHVAADLNAQWAPMACRPRVRSVSSAPRRRCSATSWPAGRRANPAWGSGPRGSARAFPSSPAWPSWWCWRRCRGSRKAATNEVPCSSWDRTAAADRR